MVTDAHARPGRAPRIQGEISVITSGGRYRRPGPARVRPRPGDREGTAPEHAKRWPPVNPGPLFGHYGENVWAGVSAYLDAVTEHAAAPVIKKYTGVLGAADIEIYTRTTTFAIMQSIRLDRGPSGPIHP